MKHQNHPRCNQTIGAGGIENVDDLRAEVTLEDNHLLITSFWFPSEAEKAAIMAGEPVSVSLWGSQPPMRVGVNSVDE